MRRFDATPRRATPKGHNPFISYATPHQEIYLHRPLSALVAHLNRKLRSAFQNGILAGKGRDEHRNHPPTATTNPTKGRNRDTP
jgi:hypothetical protein